MYTGNALASEFDVINEGPPKDSYVVDDAGVLSRVTKTDLKQLLSDLESRKNVKINFITVRKLTVSNGLIYNLIVPNCELYCLGNVFCNW